MSCRSELLDPAYLASSQADTPDPTCDSFFGQQIIVYWDIALKEPAELLLTVRYGNLEVATFTTTLDRDRGAWIYRLLNPAYADKGGILSYQARIVKDGAELEKWSHYLWAELICIGESIPKFECSSS